MANGNTVTIEGNLTRDPELRFGQSGTPVCNAGVAYNTRRRNDQGEWEDGDPQFFDVTLFGALAEHLAASLTKGDRVIVYGRLEYDTWEDKETGDKRSKVKVIADGVGASLRFAEATTRRPDGSAPRPAQSRAQAHPQAPADEEPF